MNQYEVVTTAQEHVVETIEEICNTYGISKSEVTVHTVPGSYATSALDLRFPRTVTA